MGQALKFCQDCNFCTEHWKSNNGPFLHGEKFDEKCVEHCFEWLQQSVE